ncbi:MAG: hypothetical protein AVDCRST_MAG67-4067, partial [uncultured Solirubrobacteraceae bacterium]
GLLFSRPDPRAARRRPAPALHLGRAGLPRDHGGQGRRGRRRPRRGACVGAGRRWPRGPHGPGRGDAARHERGAQARRPALLRRTRDRPQPRRRRV